MAEMRKLTPEEHSETVRAFFAEPHDLHVRDWRVWTGYWLPRAFKKRLELTRKIA